MCSKIILNRIFLKCVESVRPSRLIRSVVSNHDGILKIGNISITLNKNCFLVGFGKATYEMAIEIENILGEHVQEGIISVPLETQIQAKSCLRQNSVVRVFEGAKDNLPDENSFAAAVKMKNLAEQCGCNDILVVLISGGGSALLPYPIPPITLQEKFTTIKLLASAGADIVEINRVRKSISVLKGGKLAALAYPATVIALIISDIIADPLQSIASGPTVLSEEDNKSNAISILQKFSLIDKVASSVRQVLHENSSNQQLLENSSTFNFIIGNNRTALNAARVEIEQLKYAPIILSHRVDGFVSDIASVFSELVKYTCSFLTSQSSVNDFIDGVNRVVDYRGISKNLADDIVDSLMTNADLIKNSVVQRRGLFFISGGEPTVRVTGTGTGGRNQELAMEVALKLHDLKKACDNFMTKFDVTFMSAGTDGIDGPTDAAGAVIHSDLIDEAIRNNLNAVEFLQNNDSYSFFNQFQSGRYHFKTGHTGTNVMDLHFLVIRFKE